MTKPIYQVRRRWRDRGEGRERDDGRDHLTNADRPRVSAHVDPDLHHRLHRVTVERGETKTEFMHRAIERELATHEGRRRR